MAETKKNLEEEFRKNQKQGEPANLGAEYGRNQQAQTTDVTKNPQATTAADVNNQDTATRLWQSLKTTYGNQMEESDKAYDKAISQQDNAMLAKGMGRSSYASQIRASMYNDKANARNKLGESLIADYQNRIGQLEESEAARNFQREERVAGQDFQAGQAALNREHETALQTSSQKWQSGESALNRESQARLQESSQNFQMALQKAQNYFNAEENEKARQAQKDLQLIEQAWKSGESKLDREQSEALQRLQIEANKEENAANRDLQLTIQKLTQEFNAEESAKDRALNQSQFEAGQALTREQLAQDLAKFNAQQALTREQMAETHLQNTIANQQWEQQFNANQQQQTIANQQWEQQFIADQNYKAQQQENWKEQLGYEQLSNLQKISMEKVMAIIQNGNDPDDTLLGQAGMTRAEANGMKKQVQSGNFNQGKPEWQIHDFPDEETYKKAKDANITSYEEYQRTYGDLAGNGSGMTWAQKAMGIAANQIDTTANEIEKYKNEIKKYI
jgi:hypothetical protein